MFGSNQGETKQLHWYFWNAVTVDFSSIMDFTWISSTSAKQMFGWIKDPVSHYMISESSLCASYTKLKDIVHAIQKNREKT